MCGIVGAVSSSSVDPRVVDRMRDRLVHRGPDASGSWASEDRRVCLGHRRLSIVDLSPEANQPFLSTDGRYAITFNGEIYNFRSLRRELEREGVGFRTRSDTEVLVEAYRRWGAECLDRLSGMFAFAIWDTASRRLFCARDRAGEKPFHYAVVGESFVFASELKSLLLWPGFRRELDYEAVCDFLSFGFVVDPRTIWSDAKKLPAGHWLAVRLADRPLVGEPTRYWDLEFAPDADQPDGPAAIRATLTAAAEEMSYADVPVGAFLSGGVDSSAVTAALAHARRSVRTFTIGFDDPAYDERPWALEVAEQYGTEHSARVVRPDDVESVFRDTILWHYDEPFNDYSYLPTYYVCREAREEITVALTGDGGDELFAGYGKYRRLARRATLERAITRPVAQMLAGGVSAMLPNESGLRGRLGHYEVGATELLSSMLTTGLDGQTLRSVARGPLADAARTYDAGDVVRPLLEQTQPADVGLINSMRYLDFKLTLGCGILTKVDRASMAVSLEARPVYLHRDVLALAGRVNPRMLADGRETKKVLKSAFEPWLPPRLLSRPKMGFAMPLGSWLQDGLNAFVPSSRSRRSVLADLVDERYLGRVAAAQRAGASSQTGVLHSFLFLENWLETWLST